MLVPINARDVMRPVTTVPPDEPLDAVARRLQDADANAAVVVRDGEQVGIVTESDLVRALAEGRTDETAVGVMSAPLVTVGATASIEKAAERLLAEDIENLPVMDGDTLVGILTAADLSSYLPRLTAEPPESTHAHRTVRSDTAYEHDDWAFEFHGADSSSVEPGDAVRFSKPLSEADVRGFAEASGDTNRLHLDEAFAAETRFGGRIAHGVLTLSVVSAALARFPGLVIYLSQECSFQGPVGIGERVTAVCTVEEDLGRGKFRVSTDVFDADGDRVVEGQARVLVDPIPDDGDEAASDAREPVAPSTSR